MTFVENINYLPALTRYLGSEGLNGGYHYADCYDSVNLQLLEAEHLVRKWKQIN